MKNITKFFLPVFLFLFLNANKVFAVTSGPVSPYSFSAATGTKSGTVKITWYDDGSLSTKYNLYYGTSADKLIYAVPNLYHYSKQVNEFLVESLTPNQTYYFKLDGISGETYTTSGPVIAKASNGKINSTISTSKPYGFSLTYGPKSGTVNITWTDDFTADKYDIVYGTKPNQYLYGVHGVSYKENSKNIFTIGALTPGKTYYFALVAERNNNVVIWSQPLSITVK